MPRTAAAEHELARLQATAIALAQVMTPADAAQSVLEQCISTLEAEAGAVYLRKGNDLVPVVEIRGRRGPFAVHAIDADIPVAHCVRTGEHLFLETQVSILERFPGAAGQLPTTVAAAAILALVVKTRVIGAIGLTFENHRTFATDEKTFAAAIAAQCALALDRAELIERDRDAAERSRFLGEASAMLAASLDPDLVLRQLVHVVVPRFADWCAVELVEHDATTRLEVAHVDPAKVEWAAKMREEYPPRRDQPHGLYEVIRTGRSELYSSIPEGAVEAIAVDARHLELITQLRMRSVVIVPLTVRGKTLGGLTVVWAESDRRYSRSDLELFEEIARRAALSIDNAMLFRREQEAVQVRDAFLAAAGHELKTPLAAMLMQVDSLQRSLLRGGVPSNLGQRLEKTGRAGARLEKLIDELLDVSRITAGRLQLDPEPIALDEIVREVADRFADQAASANCPLTVTTAPTLGRWDRSRMDQVASNLIANAIKYGRGTPVAVTLAVEDHAGVLRVRDHGIGIAPAEQHRIFERFERVVESRSFGGFGLGLWIARQIVEASGGTITVTSAPGEGAMFEVRLPLSG